jgi:arylsulfatase
MTQAGPFNQWPTGRGFDRYYGFLWGEDDQYAPELWHDQHHVEPPYSANYHLSEDLAERATEYVSNHVSATPDRPFFLYLAFGACHAPHQAPPEYINRYRGTFDHGWDEERQRVLARQIQLGVVPEDTQLPPPNPGVQHWNTLETQERQLYARMQEVYAGFMEHTDTQVGRVVDFLTSAGLLDNTLITLLSDNGASGEGGIHGSANEYRYFLDLPDTLEETIAAADELGGPHAHNHYPMGWAQAGNTPLKFYKKHTFGGGVRAPFIVHWPNHLSQVGQLRNQFHHVIDVLPTVLDVTDTEAPTVYQGIPQMPVHGVSLAYSFFDPSAPSRRRIQYFETAGHRGLYEDGLKVVTNHDAGNAFSDDVFELYDLRTDFSEAHDLSGDKPGTARKMVALWWEQAKTYGVLPLDDRMQERVSSRDPSTNRNYFRLFPGARLSNGSAGPNFAGRSFTVVAQLGPGEQLPDGVLLAYGRRAAGFSFFLQGQQLIVDLNLAGHHYVLESDPFSMPGAGKLSLHLKQHNDGATLILFTNRECIGSLDVPCGMPAGLGCLTTQCGHNSPSPVSDRYQPPYTCGLRLRDVSLLFDVAAHADYSTLWAAAVGSD